MIVFHKSEMGQVGEKVALESPEVPLKRITWKIGCPHVEWKDDEVPCPGGNTFLLFL